jgi:molybdopterin-guanine dinucleotide biosynthesis protein A
VRLLGAVLAGGASTRFGGDKAVAIYQGRPLIDHAIEALRAMSDTVIVVGRQWPGVDTVADCPGPGLGPLGGLLGALTFAEGNGFGNVLTLPCDAIGLAPPEFASLLPGPAIFDDAPVIGAWPASLRATLAKRLGGNAGRSVYGFADAIGARRVATPPGLANINTPADLKSLSG